MVEFTPTLLAGLGPRFPNRVGGHVKCLHVKVVEIRPNAGPAKTAAGASVGTDRPEEASGLPPSGHGTGAVGHDYAMYYLTLGLGSRRAVMAKPAPE